MFGLGIGEIVVILVIALVFIGPKKLPELARGLGKGIREFNKAKNELMDEVNRPEKVDLPGSVATQENSKTAEKTPEMETSNKQDLSGESFVHESHQSENHEEKVVEENTHQNPSSKENT